jgi:hypothetical protein
VKVRLVEPIPNADGFVTRNWKWRKGIFGLLTSCTLSSDCVERQEVLFALEHIIDMLDVCASTADIT